MRYLARCIRDVQARHPRVRCHLYSGNTEDLAGRLDSGILDFAVIVQDVDLTKYNYLELPYADTWGVIMRKDSPLAGQEAVRMEDLLELPLICSRQGMKADYPKFFREKVDALHVVATFNLIYNATVLVREGLGYALSFDKLADTGTDSELCFRPLSPSLTSRMYVVWKKYQLFSPAAQLLLDELKERYGLR